MDYKEKIGMLVGDEREDTRQHISTPYGEN